MKYVISIFCLLLAFSVQAQSTTKFLADRHVDKGVTCEACHGNGKEKEEPKLDTCAACHPVNALVEKTTAVKPKNPHTSPHYNDKLDCINCHTGHEAPVNFCAQCHNFDFKVK